MLDFFEQICYSVRKEAASASRTLTAITPSHYFAASSVSSGSGSGAGARSTDFNQLTRTSGEWSRKTDTEVHQRTAAGTRNGFCNDQLLCDNNKQHLVAQPRGCHVLGTSFDYLVCVCIFGVSISAKWRYSLFKVLC